MNSSIVLIKDIQAKIKNTYPQKKLDNAAQLILALGGVINPLILERTGVHSYQLVKGDFEYAAAVRAKEIDPLNGESINAIIVEQDIKQKILESLLEVNQEVFEPTPEVTQEVLEPTPEVTQEVLEPTPEVKERYLSASEARALTKKDNGLSVIECAENGWYQVEGNRNTLVVTKFLRKIN